MKKAIAVLTALCLLLGTLYVPSVLFANEGTEDYNEPIVSQIEFSADADKVVTVSFLVQEESGISGVDIEATPLECWRDENYFNAIDGSIKCTGAGANANEYYYEAKFQMPERWDGKVKIDRLCVYDDAEEFNMFDKYFDDVVITLPPAYVEGVTVTDIKLDTQKVHLSDGTDGEPVAIDSEVSCELSFSGNAYDLFDQGEDIAIWFKAPNGDVRQSGINRNEEYVENEETPKVTYVATDYLDFGSEEGKYTLLKVTVGNERIELADTVGDVSFDLTKHTSDTTAPTLTGIDFIDADGNSIIGKSVAKDSEVQVKITATDDIALNSYAWAEFGLFTTEPNEYDERYMHWSKGDICSNEDDTAYVRTLLPDEDGEFSYNGEWYVESITLYDIYYNESVYYDFDGKRLGEYSFLIGTDTKPEKEYEIYFNNVDYDGNPTINTSRRTSISEIKAAGIEIPEIPEVEGASIEGWYYCSGEKSGYVDEDDIIELDPQYGELYLQPWYDQLVMGVDVGYLDKNGDSVWEGIEMLLPHGTTFDQLAEKIDSMYSGKHSADAVFKNWHFVSSEYGELPDEITPDFAHEEIVAIYEKGEVVRDEGGEGEGGFEGEDGFGSIADRWFVLDSEGGLVTYEWEENGETYTESWQSAMWWFDADQTLVDAYEDPEQSAFTQVKKDNAQFKGWKLYTGEDFWFYYNPAGEELRIGDPEQTFSYTETMYWDEAPEDFSDPGWYDEYIVIVNQEEIAKEDGSLYTTKELEEFNTENLIYYAVAQWEGVGEEPAAEGFIITEEELTEDVVEEALPDEIVENIDEGESVLEWVQNKLEEVIKEVIYETNIIEEEGMTVDYRDVTLMVVDDDGNRTPATEEDFDKNKNGLIVLLDYPEGINMGNYRDYDFIVTHMITGNNHPNKGDGKYGPGYVEELDILGFEKDGIKVRVKSLSPIAIAYQEKPDEDYVEQEHGNWKYDYNNDKKTHTKRCGNRGCDYKVVENCTFDAGVITKEASADQNGEKTFTCSVCKGTYIEEVEYIPPEPPVDTSVYRYYGADRYATSIKAANALKAELGVEKFENIIIAAGKNFADALPGSYLAAKKNAPILLIDGKHAASVKKYVADNLASGGNVYVLGGTKAIPAGWVSGLPNQIRLGGADRYETNIQILNAAKVPSEAKIMVCTGDKFADSLSASATGLPILMVSNKGLTTAQKNFLNGLSEEQYYIIGGTVAVNSSMERTLKSYGTVAKRLAGATRYETSVLVAKTFFNNPKAAVLAYSENFPDGLSGGPVAYAMEAPLLLTKTGSKSAAAVAYAKGEGIKSGKVLGGPGLINDATVRAVFGKSAGTSIPNK